jgi:hypothetical protein
MFSAFYGLFVPHHSNNYRSKLVHNSSLFALILLTVIASTILFVTRKTDPQVLGIASNINVSDLLNNTNDQRAQNGLPPLTLNSQLTDAATAKANYMFAKNFWAHNAPDGTTPWVFIQNSGYNYIYAGENLARDFNDSNAVVNAWMNSPSHRENVLNAKYDEIGFAVVNGKLSGQDTTLVVQMFGKRSGTVAAIPLQAVKTTVPSTKTTSQPTIVPTIAPTIASPSPVPATTETLVAGVTTEPTLDSTILTKNIAIAMLGIVILAFFFDMVYIERKKLFRLVGHNLDHILFLGGAIILLLLFGKGLVL